jgi:hypothetical protein
MKTLRVLALALGSWASTSAVYGLWDLARQNLSCVAKGPCGYPLPFAIYVPWYIAGDVFVTMAFAGMAAFILGANGLLSGARLGVGTSQLSAGMVASILQAAIDEGLVSKEMASSPGSSNLGLTAATVSHRA